MDSHKVIIAPFGPINLKNKGYLRVLDKKIVRKGESCMVERSSIEDEVLLNPICKPRFL
jgi:hypothetical protein